MTEDDAAAWLRSDLGVSRETMDALDRFASFLRLEAQSQNLISASTLDQIWSRHIVDSAQLLKFVDAMARSRVRSRFSGFDHCTTIGFPRHTR